MTESQDKKDQALAIVPKGVEDLQQVSPEADALEIIERRAAIWEKLQTVAIKTTKDKDWVDYHGTPHLTASGAEKIARRFGISVFDVEYAPAENFKDDKGEYYEYTV